MCDELMIVVNWRIMREGLAFIPLGRLRQFVKKPKKPLDLHFNPIKYATCNVSGIFLSLPKSEVSKLCWRFPTFGNKG